MKYISKGKMGFFLGGIVAAVAGTKVLKSDKTRDVCVKGLAKGMQIQSSTKSSLQNMKEDAQDIVYDAKKKVNKE